MGSPLVSVVIPTYNRAYILGRAIESALGQTYESVEVLVVDDGSTDETREKVAEQWGRDERVRYIYKENGGPAGARNAGFSQAQGEYVALLDSDDWWYPWKVSLQVRCMEKHRELGMTWTDMEMIDTSGRVADRAYLRRMYTAHHWFSDEEKFPRSYPLSEIAPDLAEVVGAARLRIGTIFSKMVMGNLVHTSTVLLRRERLERVGGFDETLRYSGEDWDFHLRTARAGPVGLLDLAAIQYRLGTPDQLTEKRYGINMAENRLRTVESAIARDLAIIDLPEHMIRRSLAKAHAWVALERLDLGDIEEARHHYWECLKQWPWQPDIARPLFYAVLPFGAGLALRGQLRRLRERLEQYARMQA